MRPAGLSSAIDEDRIGRIYQTRGGPDSLRWFWSMTVNGPVTPADRVATFGRGQGAVSEELGRLEGVGGVGRGGVNLGDIEPCESAMLPMSRPLGLPLY